MEDYDMISIRLFIWTLTPYSQQLLGNIDKVQWYVPRVQVVGLEMGSGSFMHFQYQSWAEG